MGASSRPIWLIEKELQDKKSRGEKVDHNLVMLVKYGKNIVKNEEKSQKKIRDKTNRNLGYIHTVKEIAEKLQFCTQTILNMIDKDQSEDVLKREFDLIKQGNEYLFQKGSLYKFISKNTYKYTNGKKSPCKYDRLPEYLKIDDCAEILKLENGRQFRRNYIDNNPARLEGVEILKIGSTVRIEQESFLRYVETLGGETAK